jgi:hypothetical protein
MIESNNFNLKLPSFVGRRKLVGEDLKEKVRERYAGRSGLFVTRVETAARPVASRRVADPMW